MELNFRELEMEPGGQSSPQEEDIGFLCEQQLPFYVGAVHTWT